jgi:hypothetical protein
MNFGDKADSVNSVIMLNLSPWIWSGAKGQHFVGIARKILKQVQVFILYYISNSPTKLIEDMAN